MPTRISFATDNYLMPMNLYFQLFPGSFFFKFDDTRMHFCKSFHAKFKARTTALPDPPKVKNHTTTSNSSVDVIAIISR